MVWHTINGNVTLHQSSLNYVVQGALTNHGPKPVTVQVHVPAAGAPIQKFTLAVGETRVVVGNHIEVGGAQSCGTFEL
jgi:hypothetical protein